MKDHSISMDQARYATSITEKYLDTVTVKASNFFYKTTFPYDMILTKYIMHLLMMSKLIIKQGN